MMRWPTIQLSFGNSRLEVESGESKKLILLIPEFNFEDPGDAQYFSLSLNIKN